MQRFDIDFRTTESDISGTCDVNYVLAGTEKTSLIIRKSKDISSCVNRYKTHSFLQTTPYDFRKHYAVWPLLNSNSYCNVRTMIVIIFFVFYLFQIVFAMTALTTTACVAFQLTFFAGIACIIIFFLFFIIFFFIFVIHQMTIDHNIFQAVVCHERHELVPFSNNGTGAITISNIELSLIEEESYELPKPEPEVNITKRVPLLFNHYPTPKPTHGEIKAARELLKQMCKFGFPNIQREFIDVFTKFLVTARVLSVSALKQLVSRASSICDNGKYVTCKQILIIINDICIQL